MVDRVDKAPFKAPSVVAMEVSARLIDAKTVPSTADLLMVAIAYHVACTVGSNLTGRRITAVALFAPFDTSEAVTSRVTGV